MENSLWGPVKVFGSCIAASGVAFAHVASLDTYDCDDCTYASSSVGRACVRGPHNGDGQTSMDDCPHFVGLGIN